MASDLPGSFDAAEMEFSQFLAARAYPSLVVWTLIKDALVDESGHYFIRKVKASRAESESQYLSGIPRGHGVELRAISASEMQTFACVDAPTDSTDAQYRMIGAGLKMSYPDRHFSATLVSGTLRV